MIPILFESLATSFNGNGLGRLTDCTSCAVTEERNGKYELEFTYPITGRYYDQLVNGATVGVFHDDSGTLQSFDIYAFSAPINGIVTFNARHISYRLSNTIIKPFSANTAASAVAGLKTNSVTENLFSFWTDNTNSGTFEVKVPSSLRGVLGGVQGSILDVYGGEYEFDQFTVKLHASRGQQTDVTIRYGKNLTNIKKDYDEGSTVNVVAPYWTDGENTVYLPGYVVVSPDAPTTLYPWTDENGEYITDENGEQIYFDTAVTKARPLDLSGSFSEAPTTAQLEQAALAYLSNNKPWEPSENIKVDFVALWQTPEYEDVAALQRVRLCDTVSVFFPELGVIAENQKVIRTVYNVLTERFDSIELGSVKTTLGDAITNNIDKKLAEVATVSMLRSVVDHATELITGGLGGYVVFNLNADGEPQEILIMDTDDISTAVNVIRMNKNGIGFSHNGYNGTYISAWTIDGSFNADFISAGKMSANYIQGGTLALGGANNDDGVLQIYDANSTLIGQLDNNGANLSGLITMYNDKIKQTVGETQTLRYNAFSGITNVLANSANVTWYDSNGKAIAKKAEVLGVYGETGFQSGSAALEEVYQTNQGHHARVLAFTTEADLDSSNTGSTTYIIEHFNGSIFELYYLDLSNNLPWRIAAGEDFFVAGEHGGSDLDQFSTNPSSGTNGRVHANKYGFRLTGGSHRFTVSDSKREIDGYTIQVQSPSSRRYKHNIEPLSADLDPHKLLDLPVVQFRYNDGASPDNDTEDRTIPGFIAEDVEEVYPSAVIHEDGQVESWDERRIIPGMLALIQEQAKKIEELENRIERLERRQNVSDN